LSIRSLLRAAALVARADTFVPFDAGIENVRPVLRAIVLKAD